MTRKELAQRLTGAGFTIVRTYGGWRWIEVRDRRGEELVIAVQGPACYHAFFTFEGTASGSTPETAADGGLGDAIATDAQMRTYRRLVLDAPPPLMHKYAGLYRASSDEYNREGRR